MVDLDNVTESQVRALIKVCGTDSNLQPTSVIRMAALFVLEIRRARLRLRKLGSMK